MKLFSVKQIREWDAYTIEQEPVASIVLMERAATACVKYIRERKSRRKDVKRVVVFCGKGNNGGDGLAIARELMVLDYEMLVCVVHHSERSSADFESNLERLHETVLKYTESGEPETIRQIRSGDPLPDLSGVDLVIDALLGSGTSKPVDGLLKEVIDHINAAGREVLSIDMPSGLPADPEQWEAASYETIVQATETLSFQLPKLTFLFPDSGVYCGDFTVLDIHLHRDYYDKQETVNYYLDSHFISGLLQRRRKFDHKGKFGHALLVAGSKGKNGAAILCARACLRSGAGLLTMLVPQHSYPILQTAVPEAMVHIDHADDYPVFSISLSRYTSVGVGAGIGTDQRTREGYRKFLEGITQPLVIDADGINLLARLLKEEVNFRIPENTVLTPHVKEFDRLAGDSAGSMERWKKLKDFARRHRVYVILKGAHSCLATPGGTCYFNSTGNPAMAKGGSGDVLTGMIAALLAQGYAPEEAAILGMYFHGLAGDRAAAKRSPSAVIASDIIDKINIT